MKGNIVVKICMIIFITTAALAAAVFLNRLAADVMMSPGLLLPDYSAPSDRTVTDDTGHITVTQKGRRLSVFFDGKKIWRLPAGVYAQDFLLEDIDHDGEDELLILCWKRGRFGKHKPTWVREDEKDLSQHIFIYEIKDDNVVPKWMASDIGMDARSWKYADGAVYIEDTDGNVTGWKWKSWGLEKL